MFNLKLKTDSTLQEAITSAQSQLEQHDADSPEYDKVLNQLERLHKLQAKAPERRVSPDTLLIVLGNLAGIFIILNYEKLDVVTSKALGFIIKPK